MVFCGVYSWSAFIPRLPPSVFAPPPYPPYTHRHSRIVKLVTVIPYNPQEPQPDVFEPNTPLGIATCIGSASCISKCVFTRCKLAVLSSTITLDVSQQIKESSDEAMMQFACNLPPFSFPAMIRAGELTIQSNMHCNPSTRMRFNPSKRSQNSV